MFAQQTSTGRGGFLRTNTGHCLLFVLNLNLKSSSSRLTVPQRVLNNHNFFPIYSAAPPPKKYSMFSDSQWTSLTFLDSVDYYPVGAVRHRRISSPVSPTWSRVWKCPTVPSVGSGFTSTSLKFHSSATAEKKDESARLLIQHSNFYLHTSTTFWRGIALITTLIIIM